MPHNFPRGECNLMPDEIRDSIAFVLDNYLETRLRETNPRKDLPVCSRLSTLRGLIDNACEERGLTDLLVDASWGKGAWNANPWIALLDRRITASTRFGFYPVFLFRSDGSGLYLSLDLGIGRRYGTPSRVELASLKEKAEYLSPYFENLQAEGLSRSLPMDLRTDRGVGLGFAAGSIVHKLYKRIDLPSSEDILRDLASVIKIYQTMCNSGLATILLNTVAGGDPATVREVVSSIARPPGNGQGFSNDSKIRLIIENHAMRIAVDHFTSEGWEVTDVHQRNPYDLDCTRGNKRLMVEVKGTTSDGAKILLTPNEVDHARSHPNEAALFICSNIVVSPTSRGSTSIQGGQVKFIHPWQPHPSLLTPLGFSYSVPPDAGHSFYTQN